MMSYIIWNVAPELFDGFIVLRWYGISWVLGVVAGHGIMLHIYKREGMPIAEVDMLTVYIMLGAIIGARVGHILFYDPVYYLQNPIEVLPIKIDPEFQFTGLAGLASHGGILGAVGALYIYNRKFPKGYLWLLDRLTIAGVVLGGFIRLGNLMNSEIIGTPSDLPWAFVFERIDQIPRHPSQLYEAIFYFITGVVLYFTWRSKRFYAQPGFIFGLAMTLIFAQRFLIEFIKENQVSFEETLILNMGQVLSIPLVVGGIAIMIWSLRKQPLV